MICTPPVASVFLLVAISLVVVETAIGVATTVGTATVFDAAEAAIAATAITSMAQMKAALGLTNDRSTRLRREYTRMAGMLLEKATNANLSASSCSSKWVERKT